MSERQHTLRQARPIGGEPRNVQITLPEGFIERLVGAVGRPLRAADFSLDALQDAIDLAEPVDNSRGRSPNADDVKFDRDDPALLHEQGRGTDSSKRSLTTTRDRATALELAALGRLSGYTRAELVRMIEAHRSSATRAGARLRPQRRGRRPTSLTRDSGCVASATCRVPAVSLCSAQRVHVPVTSR